VADDLKAFAKRCREVGRKDLSRELNKAITDVVRPLKTELPASALRKLPRRGGLAKRVAESKIGVRKKPEGVTVVTKNKYDLAKLDAGFNRHPVLPRRGTPRSQWVWVEQRVRPGWFTEPAEALKPEAIRRLDAALKEVARKLEG
jgi:hypothetical protein